MTRKYFANAPASRDGRWHRVSLSRSLVRVGARCARLPRSSAGSLRPGRVGRLHFTDRDPEAPASETAIACRHDRKSGGRHCDTQPGQPRVVMQSRRRQSPRTAIVVMTATGTRARVRRRTSCLPDPCSSIATGRRAAEQAAAHVKVPAIALATPIDDHASLLIAVSSATIQASGALHVSLQRLVSRTGVPALAFPPPPPRRQTVPESSDQPRQG
jgi:hypothetical protein